MLSSANPRQLTQYSGIALRAGVLAILFVITLAVVGGTDTFSFISLNQPVESHSAFVPTNSTAAEVGDFRFIEANTWDYRHGRGIDKLTNMLFIEQNVWDYRPELLAYPDMLFAELNRWDYPARPERLDTVSIQFAEDNSWDHRNQPVYIDYGIQNR